MNHFQDCLCSAFFIFFFSWFSRVEREKSQGLDPSKTSGTLKTAEEVKAHLENQLKQARLAAQQVTTRYSYGCRFSLNTTQ